MIYRTDAGRGEVHQPLDWKVYSAARKRIPLGSEEALRVYLKNHPDEDFFLIPGPFMNREIQGEEAATFDPRGEHIRCGIVRYDSAADRIVTRDSPKVTYSDRVKKSGEEYSTLEDATMRLEEVLGPSTPYVMIAWDRDEGAGKRQAYTLRVSDWTSEVSKTFTPEELRSNAGDLYGWRSLWGDLLEARSDKQLYELTTRSSRAGG